MSKLNMNRLAFFALGTVLGGWVISGFAAILKPRSVR